MTREPRARPSFPGVSHQCRVERNDHLTQSAGNAFPDATQMVIVGHLCSKGLVMTHSKLATVPLSLFLSSLSSAVVSQLVLMHVIISPQEKDFSFPFAEVNEIPLYPFFQMSDNTQPTGLSTRQTGIVCVALRYMF